MDWIILVYSWLSDGSTKEYWIVPNKEKTSDKPIIQQIEIINTTGHCVRVFKINEDIGIGMQAYSIGNLVPSVYQFRIKTNEGLKIARIIKR